MRREKLVLIILGALILLLFGDRIIEGPGVLKPTPPTPPRPEEMATPRQFTEKMTEYYKKECDYLYSKRREDMTHDEKEQLGVCVMMANPNQSPWDMK